MIRQVKLAAWKASFKRILSELYSQSILLKIELSPLQEPFGHLFGKPFGSSDSEVLSLLKLISSNQEAKPSYK